MGSYNKTCFVSHVTIECDDVCYFFPVVVNKDYNGDMFRPTDMYEPITLPILCKYDDYGSVVAIENDNSRYIARKFKMDINEFMNGNHKLFNMGLLVHEHVYNAISNNSFRDYDGKKKEDYNYEEEYYKYSRKLMQEVKSSLKSIKLYKRFQKEQPNIDNFETIANYWNDIKTFDFYLGGNFFFELILRNMEQLKSTYIKTFTTRKLMKEMISFVKFNYHMFSCGCAYIPVVNGPQYGNHYMIRVMLKAATEVNSAKIKHQKSNRMG